MVSDIYGRIVNKFELKQLKKNLMLESQEEGELIPVFFSPNSMAMLDYFYKLNDDGKKFRDTIKLIHKSFGGRGEGQFVVFFTADREPIISGISFRKCAVPNIFEAKFIHGTIIEIKEIL